MIEFFSFVGCIIAFAVLGMFALYIALFILAAFILLNILNKKYKSEDLKNSLSDVEPFIHGTGLFIVVIGILKLPQLSNEASYITINAVKFVGAFLGGVLVLSFIVALLQGFFRKK